jgi:hypothetical protein
MKRTTKTAPKASPLYARIRNVPELNTRLPVVPKGHALRDEFDEARTTAGAKNRKSKTSLLVAGEQIGRTPDAT